MLLETSMELLHLSEIRNPAKQIRLTLDTKGTICVANKESTVHQKLPDLLLALNKLKTVNEAISSNALSLDDDSQISELCQTVLQHMGDLDLTNLGSLELSHFFKLLSLHLSSDKVNQTIKKEVSVELVDSITVDSYRIIDVLRDLDNLQSIDRLLLGSSFVSPLLITVSFCHRLNYTVDEQLIKLLSLLFIFHLTSPILLSELMKLFVISRSTNIELFQVFNQLWNKTLESHSPIDLAQAPGPITLLNRMYLLKRYDISGDLIERLIPFDMKTYLLKLSRDLVEVHSELVKLVSIEHLSDTQITGIIIALLSHTSTKFGAELVKLLISTMNLEKTFMNLHQKPQFKDAVHIIFVQLSSILELHLKNDTTFSHEIVSSDILDVIKNSKFARYKALFEVIDHNHKINYQSDHRMLFLLKHSLYFSRSEFDLLGDSSVISDLGSSLSLTGTYNYVSFILQKSLLNYVCPTRDLPLSFQKTMQLRKIPPLPRSDFLGFEFINSPKSLLESTYFESAVLALQSSTFILNSIIREHAVHKKVLNTVDRLGARILSVEVRAADVLLEQIYTVLFTNLILTTEFQSKGAYFSKESSQLLFDYCSISNVIELQTFTIFENILKVYGSFGFYKLVKFIETISMKDLQIQKLSLKVLNHLIFHDYPGNLVTGLKELILENSVIRDYLKRYVILWNDNTKEYEQILELLQVDKNYVENITFDSSKFLELLGMKEAERPHPIISPVPSSSTSSSISFNMTANPNELSGNTSSQNSNQTSGLSSSDKNSRVSSSGFYHNNQAHLSGSGGFIRSDANKSRSLASNTSNGISTTNNNTFRNQNQVSNFSEEQYVNQPFSGTSNVNYNYWNYSTFSLHQPTDNSGQFY